MTYQRKIFIQSLFQYLKDREYHLLKYIENSVDVTDENSDLDILLKDKDWESVISFFLHAPIETILNRKKELSPEAIVALTTNYKCLFAELANTYPQEYLSVQNVQKMDTLNFISKQIKQYI